MMVTWRTALMGLCLPGTALLAQGKRVGASLRAAPHVGIGYVASVPITALGFSGLFITPKLLRGGGVFADVKLTTSSPGKSPYFLPGVTVEQAAVTFGDRLYEQKSDWTTVDVGVVYAVTGEFALYGGAGYSKETHYREYFDDTQTRGNLGFYWVADPGSSGTRINGLGGALLRLSRFLMFQLGVQSAPTAANVGMTLTFSP
jgi:hypothetical protein